VILRVDGQQVFGMLHQPTGAERSRPAVAIFHGLVGSKDQPHQLFVKLAEALAQAGFVALRIDLRGRGDSEGDMASEITPEGDVLDARAALDYLAAHAQVDAARLGVIGLSWGGTVAALIAGRDPRVAAAVLWNAAAEVNDWRPEYQEVDGRPVVEMFGNLIGRQFYEGLRPLRVFDELSRTRGRVLLVQSEADEAIHAPVAAAQQAAQTLAAAGVPHEVVLAPEADHALMRVVWERHFIQVTVEWLQAQL
jgi:dienelactone hydrolase